MTPPGQPHDTRTPPAAPQQGASAEAARKQCSERWLAGNREAVAAYNRSVAGHGVFSDGLRSF